MDGKDGTEDRPGRFILLEDGQTSSSSKVDPSLLKDGYVRTNLTKWDLLRGTTYRKFRYDKFYHKQDAEGFVNDFLSSEDVQRELLSLKASSCCKVVSFTARPVKATTTTMAFFDHLLGVGDVVRLNGQLVKCMDDYFEGFHVQDRLREILLNEDNEYELDNGPVFSEEDKEEFLYCIFRHLAIGGSLCQFEDTLDPYLEVAKLVYKELLTVWRNPRTSKPEVASGVYQVTSACLQAAGVEEGGVGEERRCLFEGEDGGSSTQQDFLYVATDPFRRTCKAWLHKFKNHW
ncbi:cilia- and flagella-associated protein [Chloropicon primus]|nr:cilia- and flagella-associated protein [Chloropicon primus]